jgi:hypothetical protein
MKTKKLDKLYVAFIVFCVLDLAWIGSAWVYFHSR